MIKLYHAPFSRSCRVRWMLEELGLDYEIVPMQFGNLSTPEYLAKNPNARVPTLEDGDTVIWESGAILQYLLETYGEGRFEPKPGTPERAPYLQWFHWAEGTALPPLADLAQHTMVRPEERRIPALVPDAIERMGKCLDVVEQALAGKQYLAGSEFTAADVMVGYFLHMAKFTGQLGEKRPNASAYLARLAERPAFQKAFGA